MVTKTARPSQPRPIAAGQLGIDLLQIATQEAEARKRFEEKYHRENTPPVKPVALSIKNVGVAFWLSAAQATSSVLLASMRTGSMFYHLVAADLGTESVFPGVGAALSLLVIDGGLVILPIVRQLWEYQDGKTGKAKKAESKQAKSDKLPMRYIWLWVALVTLLLMSTTAGFGQAVKSIESLGDGVLTLVQWALTIIMGLGSSFIAFVWGEIMGEQIVTAMRKYEKAMQTYDDKIKSYNQLLKNAWERSAEYMFIRGALETADVVQAVRSLRRKKRTNSKTEQANTKPEPKANAAKKTNVPVKTQKIIELIVRSLAEKGSLPEVGEIAKELGVAKSTASETLTKWTTVTTFLQSANGSKPTVDQIVSACNGVKLSKAVAQAMQDAWFKTKQA